LADPLESSRQKISWAEKRFDDLHREIEEFLQMDPYEHITEPHPDKPGYQVQKFKLTKHLPPSIPNITSEVAQNLRNALDNAAYSVAVAAGVTDPKNCAFPFAGSLDSMRSSIGRAKDVTKEMQSLFVGFQSYLGGDDLLWALNEIAIADKHKTVIPIGSATVRFGVNIQGTGYFEMPDPHVWDRAKNEMVLITLGPGAECNYQFGLHLFVAFNDIRVVDGKNVLKVLFETGFKVKTIIDTIEFEARRLRIFK
jgi:hypothetical protein